MGQIERDFMWESEVAELLRVKVNTLRAWAVRRRGPGGRMKIGGKVAYRVKALRQWLDCRPERAGGGASHAPAAA
jgi:hypothetical protein